MPSQWAGAASAAPAFFIPAAAGKTHPQPASPVWQQKSVKKK
jgi:hypothetical protein